MVTYLHSENVAFSDKKQKTKQNNIQWPEYLGLRVRTLLVPARSSILTPTFPHAGVTHTQELNICGACMHRHGCFLKVQTGSGNRIKHNLIFLQMTCERICDGGYNITMLNLLYYTL